MTQTATKPQTSSLLDNEPEVADVQPAGLAVVIEKLAANPHVDVAKLEKVIELQERILAFQATTAFDAAFSQMQPEVPTIDERGKIIVRGQLRSTFAPLEDIHEVVKPIMQRFGFAIRHRTEWPAEKPGTIRIVGILSHAQGHREESVFEAAMDQSEYRSDIQSQGSTVSYGRRYTTIDLLNISTRGQDNDGQRTTTKDAPPQPEGYTAWIAVMGGLAENGMTELGDAWNKSQRAFRDYITRYDPQKWADLKATARTKDAAAAKRSPK